VHFVIARCKLKEKHEKVGPMFKTPRKKLPLSALIGFGVFTTLCGLAIIMSAIGSISSTPSTTPTTDVNAINTAVLETAIALHLQTLSAQSPTPENTPTDLPTETQAPTLTATTQPSQFAAAPGASCIPNNPPQTGRVVDVVDGDTIKVLLDQDGKTYSVRYIGMDTPENTSQVEYFGAEATAKNAEMVYGKTVALIKDVSETDRYYRLLRYVLVDNVFVNYELVAQGYANTASYPPDTSCIPTFQAAEQQASSAKLGLWDAPPTAPPAPTLALLPTQPSTGSSGSGGSSGGSGGNAVCSCAGNLYNCPDFPTHASAQACYEYCISIGRGDVHRLDRDNDGSACENNP
jgi:endonuclease YncB( thermonuclease family)